MSKSEYKFAGTGLGVKERNAAEKKFEDYKKNYHIDKLSDLELLSEKVFREALQERTKSKIGLLLKNKKVNSVNAVPRALLKVLDDNLEQILKIDDKLGLFAQKNDNDPIKYINKLKRKMHNWCIANPDRYKTCPWCSKSIELIVKPEHYNIIKHPFYKDNAVYNEHSFKLLKEGKITKLDVAKILLGAKTQSVDYVDWVLEVVIPSFSNLPVTEVE